MLLFPRLIGVLMANVVVMNNVYCIVTESVGNRIVIKI